MSSGARGFAVFRSGWNGSVTITGPSDNVATVPSSHVSSLRFASTLMAAGKTVVASDFSFSVNASGRFVFTSTSYFSLTFAGNAGSRLGFDSDTGSASSHAADSAARGSVFPYSEEAMRYTLDVPISAMPGFSLYSRSIMRRTPGTDWKAPDAMIQALRATSLEVVEAFADADTPGKVSILIDPSTVIDHHLGSVKCSTSNELVGWSTSSIEVAL